MSLDYFFVQAQKWTHISDVLRAAGTVEDAIIQLLAAIPRESKVCAYLPKLILRLTQEDLQSACTSGVKRGFVDSAPRDSAPDILSIGLRTPTFPRKTEACTCRAGGLLVFLGLLHGLRILGIPHAISHPLLAWHLAGLRCCLCLGLRGLQGHCRGLLGRGCDRLCWLRHDGVLHTHF